MKYRVGEILVQLITNNKKNVLMSLKTSFFLRDIFHNARCQISE